MLITVSGIDSAGKTTQIELLEKRLVADGKKVTVLWHRPGYSPRMDALRALIRKLRPGALPPPGQSERREETFSNPKLRKRWTTMALVDSAIEYGVKLRLQRLRGRVVICDRYLDDSMLDLHFKFPELEVENWRLARFVKRVAPKPSISILLMLPHEVMLRRMELKNEPFPDPPEIRDRRYDIYRGFADSGNYVVVDASATLEEVHEDIYGQLRARTRVG